LQNGAGWGSGRVGGGLVLDGVDDRVRVADSPSLSITGQGLTLEAWVKPDTVSGYRVLVHKEGHYTLALADGRLTYADSVTWSYDTMGYYGSVPMGEWSHVAVTFDGSVVRYYVNGALVGTKARAGSLTDNSQPVCLGAYACNSCRLDGILDEVVVYNRALTASEVQARYQEGLGPTAR